MLDNYNRKINYLRVSVTDRCNLRCSYCHPKEGASDRGQADILRFEELHRLVRLAVGLGITKVRITGGEPLVRKGLVGFIAGLRRLEGLDNISLTTNGILLAPMAAEIKQAGIRRINISLDSLSVDKYARITGGGDLLAVLAGIKEAQRLGFDPIKINQVSLRGINDDEILDFAALAHYNPFQVRFIELMPMVEGQAMGSGGYISNEEVRRIIERVYPLQAIDSDGDNAGPARIFALPGGAGQIGFISPLSHTFCDSCNRLRLTADGVLLSCLLNPEGIDLKGPLRSGSADEELRELLRGAIMTKPWAHQLRHEDCRIKKCSRMMYAIGG